MGTRAWCPFEFEAVFDGIASSGEVDEPVRFIRPLCPTHWLCRFMHYKTIIDSLLEMSAKTSDIACEWIA